MEEEKNGTRCAVCTGCGRCFTESLVSEDASKPAWSGKRCEVCVSCGKCLEAWGLIPGDDADAVTGPTNWAEGFKVLDDGSAGAPPPMMAPPGLSASADERQEKSSKESAQAQSSGAVWKISSQVDAVTGATPGVAAACKELGLDDMESLHRTLGIKPPGES